MISMKIPAQKIPGRFCHNSHQERGLILYPEAEDSPAVYLRYALTEMGTERPFFPAVVLDDWGQERKKWQMLQWIRQEGQHFPRAEAFGLNAHWQEDQCFLRDMELHVGYPVWGNERPDEPYPAGQWLKAVLIPTAEVQEPVKTTKPPAAWPMAYPQPLFPFTLAQVSWWLLPLHQVEGFNF